MLTFALLIIVGTWICLDRTQLFQVMISRPIVIGPLFGFWAGEPVMGAALGAGFEFLYAGRLPVGSNIPPCDTLAALGAVGLLVLVPGFRSPGEAGLAAALALPLAEWGRVVDVWIRKANGRLAMSMEALLNDGDISYVESTPWISASIGALAYGFSLFGFYIAGSLIILYVGRLSPWAENGFAMFLAALPLLGLAESATTLDARRFSKWAAAGLATGIFLLTAVA